ncbi:MAG: glycoside hydrolase family 127 protein [Clostridia bacterium]|nr:glycoside hydrolase family 127 protein [Clostridia bacterium]
MHNIYEKNTANYPRLKTDIMFDDLNRESDFGGFVDEYIRYIEDFQLLDEDLWTRFVQQFNEDADFDAGWRGEYWGKMMRGSAMTYAYTKNPRLYAAMEKTVNDMIDSADDDGRISSYGCDHEFDGWDMWSRKYVMLGMQYFMEVCKDKQLNDRIIESMKKQADYIIAKIGDEEGKLPITSATRHWRGLNSSSILEPIVRLYNITGEKRYFEFAQYIVSSGGTDVENIFELAYENKFYPYQYPVTKAYEMTSCFEGLLEFYRITGIEKYKTALINYADRILESDFTVIGCAGCTHELFDHSTVRQSNTTNGEIMQETCVTVTLMKFFWQMTLLTGNSRYVDAFEISMYNAYFGSINTEKIVKRDVIDNYSTDCITEIMPFDSYSPLTAGVRGTGIGGFKVMSDNHYYGCCACIGSAGVGLIPKMAMLAANDGYVINLFINGVVKMNTECDAEFNIQTDYPKTGKVNITVNADGEFTLYIRNPHWSDNTEVTVNCEKTEVCDGYIKIRKHWKKGDRVELNLDMRTKVVYPIEYGHEILMNKVIWGHNYMVSTYDEQDPEALNHIALTRGPITLAQDSRNGYSVDEPSDIKIEDGGYVEVIIPKESTVQYPHIVEANIPLANGEYMTVTDYASAGKLWSEQSKMAAWIRVK